MAQSKAGFCCLWAYIFLIWFALSVNNEFGPVFLISMVFELSPRLIDAFFPTTNPLIQDQPFVIVPTLILLSIFSVFGYLSTVFLTLDSLKEKHFFNDRTELYKTHAKAKIACNCVIFIGFILYRSKLMAIIINFVSQF